MTSDLHKVFLRCAGCDHTVEVRGKPLSGCGQCGCPVQNIVKRGYPETEATNFSEADVTPLSASLLFAIERQHANDCRDNEMVNGKNCYCSYCVFSRRLRGYNPTPAKTPISQGKRARGRKK